MSFNRQHLDRRRAKPKSRRLRSIGISSCVLVVALFSACCAHTPRVTTTPYVTEVSKLNFDPVAKAGRATRDAVRDVAAAGSVSREAGRKVSYTTRRLADSLARAEAIAVADRTKMEDLGRESNSLHAVIGDMRGIITDLEKETMALAAAHAFSEEKEKAAILTIDNLEAETAILKENAASQAWQIERANKDNQTLRAQVETLAASTDRLAIAEDKLVWWRWRFAPVTLGIIIAGILLVVYRPRIPFL